MRAILMFYDGQSLLLKFYINGTLVWSGSDSTFTSGQVGIPMYLSTTSETFYTNWAQLGMSQYYSATSLTNALEAVEADQIELIPELGITFSPEGVFASRHKPNAFIAVHLSIP